MGLLQKLFGPGKRPESSYVDAGVQLSHYLQSSLDLQGWQNGFPNYTQSEMEAIEREMAMWQRMANEEMGGEAHFHPEAIDLIRRTCNAQALENLAGGTWKYSEGLPDDWKSCLSTYLKAWACKLNPQVFLDIAELMTRAGYKGEARRALQVVLLFPGYADRYFGGADNTTELVNSIVLDAQRALQEL